ncbi:MAG: L-lysine 6-transaminase [Calditrichaeota bacterium]|nr:MAG: L-lysine 6-transaminase [Calditrichota bacterium]
MFEIKPEQVIPTLRKHMLVDGYHMVLDLEKCEGQYVYDALNQRKYLDLFGFFATSPVGHNHPALREPEFEKRLLRAARLKPSNSDFYTREMAEFVATFSRVAIPDYLPHLFMISGGALAVENALKTAFDWKVRKNFRKGYQTEKGHQVLHFREAFHGRSGYTLSLTNTADPRKYQYFTRFDWPRITNPKITFPLSGENLEKVIALEKQAEQEILQAFAERKDDIAAIIIEPIQGEGGDNHFRPEFLARLREIADENEAMLIFDEVQTGIGLTGEMWAHQALNVKPDIMAFGKKTQVCGILAGTRVDEVENNVFHERSRINSTWGGNLVDMVRFQKYLEIIESENLLENVRHTGEYFKSKLAALSGRLGEDVMSNLRGRGLMLAFDLPSGTFRDAFVQQCQHNGLLIFGCGHRSIRVRPMLDLQKSHVDEAIEIIEKSLKEVLAKKLDAGQDAHA